MVGEINNLCRSDPSHPVTNCNAILTLYLTRRKLSIGVLSGSFIS